MFKFVLAVGMVMSINLYAREYDPTSGTGTAKAFYFEPTQDEYDCCHRGISDQMDRYREAKEIGDFDTALANTLFHFQKAWLWNNLAWAYLSSMKPASYTQGNLEKCIFWLKNAIKEANIEKLPRYQAEASKCRKTAQKTLHWVQTLGDK